MLIAGMLAISCGQKKKNDDIIVKRVETPKPQGPIRMQEYKQTKDIEWLHKDYQVEVRRVADDSLKMVKDENGQKFVDNRITIRIMRSDGSVFFNQTGNAGMATAGSGDVLTGILTGLLARGYSQGDACKLGMYLHGLAGDIAAKELGEESMMATDLIKYLPKAFERLKD